MNSSVSRGSAREEEEEERKSEEEEEEEESSMHTTISLPVLEPSLRAEGDRPSEGGARLAEVMTSTTSTPLLIGGGGAVVVVVVAAGCAGEADREEAAALC